MHIDLDTFITTLYVLIDDWYTAEMAEKMKRHAGAPLKMSDSEVLTVALAGQWDVGVPWQTERSLVRYMNTHGRHWFPQMLQRSAFNERVRSLWAAVVVLQQEVAGWLQTVWEGYEVVDCVPLPACSLAQAKQARGHWLYWGQKGHGGTRGGWYWGDQVLLSVIPCGAVTGWLIGSAQADDRWFLQALISQRQGRGALVGPAPRQANRPSSPPTHIGPALTCGNTDTRRTYLADKGFGGGRWLKHWLQHYQVQVLCVPQKYEHQTWCPKTIAWHKSSRQIVETVFALLTRVFRWQRLNAHSSAGQRVRVALALAGFNLGIFLNRLFQRSDLSHETLIC